MERKERRKDWLFFLRTTRTEPLRNCFSDLQEQALGFACPPYLPAPYSCITYRFPLSVRSVIVIFPCLSKGFLLFGLSGTYTMCGISVRARQKSQNRDWSIDRLEGDKSTTYLRSFPPGRQQVLPMDEDSGHIVPSVKNLYQLTILV